MKYTIEQLEQIYFQKKDDHRQNWKKIQALVNFAKIYAASQDRQDRKTWEYLEFFIRAYQDGFMWKEEEALLDRIIEEFRIDYSQWAVKNSWVKMQMINGFKCKRGQGQMEFFFVDLDKKRIEDREKMPLWSKIERYKKIQPRISA